MARRSLWRRSKAGRIVPGELIVLASPGYPVSQNDGAFAVDGLLQSSLAQNRCLMRDRCLAGVTRADKADALVLFLSCRDDSSLLPRDADTKGITYT